MARSQLYLSCMYIFHEGVLKWKHFPRYWPFVRGIHRFPVNSPHKDQWRRAFIFFFLSSSLICFWINGWVNKLIYGDVSWGCTTGLGRWNWFVGVLHGERRTGWIWAMGLIYGNPPWERPTLARLGRSDWFMGVCQMTKYYTIAEIKWYHVSSCLALR